MIHNIKELFGNKLASLDGDIGHVKDFYFDDKAWVIRYLVADTGSWLTGQMVLLTPHSFGRVDAATKNLHVQLTRKQIEKSPSIESHKPVSRQYEIEYYSYYGWPAYWEGGALWGLGGYPVVPQLTKVENAMHAPPHHKDDKHLRSLKAMIGYRLHTTDGEIGEVSGLRVDMKSWSIRDLVVDTGHWYSGKEILISPDNIERISYEESAVFVNLSKADIEQTPANEPAGVT